MVGSSLVSYKKESPNCDSTRTKPISKITVHHMAGNLTVEACGDVFSSPSRQASAQYGIGSDGRIGQYVSEDKRSWASANYNNDSQAITIEVANDEIGGNWHVSDAAFNSLIDLCVDICTRYNFRLEYDGTPNGSLTRHNMFVATTCPGPYLESRFPEIVQLVNARLDGGESPVVPTPTPEPPVETNVDIFYRVKTQAHGWLSEVKNLDDYAGWQNSSVTDVAMRVSQGNIQYRVHVLGGGWLPYVSGCNINDTVYGYAGNGQVIDAIEAYYFTPDNVRPFKKVKYMVNNYPWQYDNEQGNGQDGYAGAFGVPVKELRMIIE